MVQLIRKKQIEIDGEPVQTIGNMYVIRGGKTVASFTTIELAWNKNRTSISCIPPEPGGYDNYELFKLDSSPAFNYEHYLVKGVPNRRGIKIHRGNYYTQIEGCILIGKGHTDINNDGVVDVVDSTRALTEFIAVVGDRETLAIKSLV